LKTSEYRHIGRMGSKIAQKNPHMIFEHSLNLYILICLLVLDKFEA